jgi:hypothetical protein
VNRLPAESEQHRIDQLLHESLGGIERPSLSDEFDRRLLQELPTETPTTVVGSSRGRWMMFFYWLATAASILFVLYRLGSPDPGVTWAILGALAFGLSICLLPLLLFAPNHRRGLMDLILVTIR